MKSIKEKAIEIYPALEDDVSGTSENLVRREGFYTGANYVLGEIGPIIKADIGSYKFQLDRIKQIIEQLLIK